MAKSFEQFTRDIAEYINRPIKPPIPECLEGLEDPDAEGGYIFPCNSCGEHSPIYCDPEDFDEHYHYCGRSERCCP